jgi:hypothetical protein
MGIGNFIDIDHESTASAQSQLTRKDKTMTVLQATRTKTSSGATRYGRLFVLELNAGRIHSTSKAEWLAD